MSVCRVSDDPNKRFKVEDFEIGVERTVSYPSAWFNAHPGVKPPVSIAKLGTLNRAQIHATVAGSFGLGKLDITAAMVFIRTEFNLKPSTLDTDWKSFDLVIGAANAAVNLDNLVDFQEAGSVAGALEGTTLLGDKDVLKLIVAICSIFRLAQITRPDYRAIVLANIGKLLAGIKGIDIELGFAVDYYAAWILHGSYLKLMATVDMYLNEFPNHPYSQARIGTIVSRFRDCSALISTRTLMDTLGLQHKTFAPWIWTSRCADQFCRVIKGDEEMDNIRSYAMYFMDLGLSSKSPYSASANPDLHLFYHTLGTSAGLERSLNARYVGAPEVHNVLNNAMVLHYVLGTYANFGEQFNLDGKKISVELSSSGTSGEPQDKNPGMWLGYIQGLSSVIPRHIVRVSTMQWIRGVNSRDGTVGRVLYDRATAINASEED